MSEKLKKEVLLGDETMVVDEKVEEVEEKIGELGQKDDAKIVDFDLFDIYSFMKKEKKEKTNSIEDYETKLESGETFKIEFPCVDEKGNLYVFESGLKIQMDNRDIDGFGYNPKYRSDRLVDTYTVVVKEIDKAKKIVKVSAHIAKVIPRKKLEEALRQGIENKEYLRVPAEVVSIGLGGTMVMINIGGLGIAGCVRLSEWSTAFTKTFYNGVRVGDEIDVVVNGYWFGDKTKMFDCSRRLTIDFDPWKNIKKRLPLRTVVKLTCISKEAKNFFGIINGVPELNVYCEYPEPESGIEIAEGIEYSGYVAAVSESKKLLRCRIIKKI